LYFIIFSGFLEVTKNSKSFPPAFIPQTPFCGRNPNPNSPEKISLGFAKSFPQKKDFRFTESAFRLATLPEYLEGRTPKKKNVLSFLEKIHPRANQKSKGHFFFLGLPSEARQWRNDTSVRFSFKPPRAPRVRHHLFWK